jgi:hypothetical protein
MKIFAEMLIFRWSFFACREADESRLREVCESFLGPPVGMAGSVPSMDPKNPVWDPDVLVSLLFLGNLYTRLTHLHFCPQKMTFVLSQVVSFLDNHGGS